jgi:hypothetical protein
MLIGVGVTHIFAFYDPGDCQLSLSCFLSEKNC